MPLSTAYRWLSRAERGDARAVERAFLNSPEGLAMLHRIVTSAQLVFVQAGGCGADRVSEFLILCDLDEHVAASHGSQLGTAARVTKLLGEYGDAQRAQLGATMAPRRIVVCEYETFHPAICLVAIDAESGMILLERYAPRRDGETWTTALAAELEGLPVEVLRVVGDEAKGLIAHARRGLGVEHGADLFHIQHDLSAATARALAQRLAEPRRRLDEAQAATLAWRDRKAEYERGPRGPGRPMNYDRRIDACLAVEAERKAVLDAALADQAAVRGAVRELGDAYHPVDLETGALQPIETLRARIDALMVRIDAVAQRIRLPQAQRERIGPQGELGRFGAMAPRRIQTERIAAHWEDLLRIAGSLQHGSVRASDFMRSLQAGGRVSRLRQALVELGRVVRTVYLLGYLSDADERRRVQVQLNRGESRHALARAVFFGRRGEIRQAYKPGQEDQLGALGMVVNAIALWNTLYLGEVVDALQRAAQPVDPGDLAQVSPLLHAHILMTGRYRFELPPALVRGARRRVAPALQ